MNNILRKFLASDAEDHINYSDALSQSLFACNKSAYSIDETEITCLLQDMQKHYLDYQTDLQIAIDELVRKAVMVLSAPDTNENTPCSFEVSQDAQVHESQKSFFIFIIEPISWRRR
jgi:hypothetical protein